MLRGRGTVLTNVAHIDIPFAFGICIPHTFQKKTVGKNSRDPSLHCGV